MKSFQTHQQIVNLKYEQVTGVFLTDFNAWFSLSNGSILSKQIDIVLTGSCILIKLSN